MRAGSGPWVRRLPAGAPTLGSLQPLLSAAGGAAPSAQPAVTLRDSRVEAMTPLGAVIVEIEGEAWPDVRGATAAALWLALEGEPGRLDGTLDLSAEPDGTITGSLAVEDGALDLPVGATRLGEAFGGARVGGLAGHVAFTLRNGLPQTINAALSLRQIALPDADFEAAALRLQMTESRTVASADLRAADGRWSAKLRARLDGDRAAPEIRLDLAAEAVAGARLWSLFALPGPDSGKVTASLHAAGRLPPLGGLAGGAPAVFDRLTGAELDGRLSLELRDLSYPGRIETGSGSLVTDLTFKDGTLTLTLPDDVRIAATGLAPAWLTGMGLPAALAALLADGADLVLFARGTPPARARLTRGAAGPELALAGALRLSTPSGAEAEVRADARLRLDARFAVAGFELDDLDLRARALPLAATDVSQLRVTGALAGGPKGFGGDLDLALSLAGPAAGPIRAAGAEVDLPVTLRADGGKLSLRLRARGNILAERLRYGDTVELDAPLRLAIPDGELRLERGRDGGLSLSHALVVERGDRRASLRRGDGAPLTLQARLGRLRLDGAIASGAPYRGRVEMANARLVLGQPGIAAERLSGTLRLGGVAGSMLAEFEAGALRQLGDAPLFAPLRVSGTLRLAGGGLAFTAEGSGPGGAGLLSLAGRHRIDDGRGELRIALAPLGFEPDGLQPATIFPLLGELRAVSGQAEAAARLAWAAGEPLGDASLTLSNLSFATAEVAIEGLSLKLVLDRLWPPRSPPGQRLTIRRVDPGLPVDDVAVGFRIEPGDPPRLVIEDGAVLISGGRVSVGDTLLDPAAGRHVVTLRVDGLNLEELFGLLDVAGLSGSGRLSGTIPITLRGKTVVIEDGRLDAVGPGVLRFRSDEAARLLGGGGEPVELMLRALADFHYDELSLAIEKTAFGETRLTLGLLGSNPEVLEGYPFRFNINIEGSTDSILAALSAGYRLSSDLVRRLWLFGR
ncbi:MAG: YdbH domain-containing protein, partial [Kiloniellaceae bacterium]